MSNELRAGIMKFIDEALRDQVRFLGLSIAGVEVTQAIQHWHAADHLTDPADRGSDNSVRLVADKPAYVRVYVRSHRGDLAGVVGSVTMRRRRRGLWADAGTLMRLPPRSVTAETSPGYAAERGDLDATLNFFIPAALMRGPMRLAVHVEIPRTNHRADTEPTSMFPCSRRCASAVFRCSIGSRMPRCNRSWQRRPHPSRRNPAMGPRRRTRRHRC